MVGVLYVGLMVGSGHPTPVARLSWKLFRLLRFELAWTLFTVGTVYSNRYCNANG